MEQFIDPLKQTAHTYGKKCLNFIQRPNLIKNMQLHTVVYMPQK